MITPAPEPVEVPPDELPAAERWARDFAVVSTVHGPRMVGCLLAEYDRMKAELTRTYSDCGICKLGGRMIYINDDCPRHGDDDGISW